MNIKIGDKLLCIKRYKSRFYRNELCLCEIEYEVLSANLYPNGGAGIYVKCEGNIRYLFSKQDIETYFLTPSEIRKEKLKKLGND